jgi:hypothetical protein
VERVQEAQQLQSTSTVLDSVSTVATGVAQWLGGA